MISLSSRARSEHQRSTFSSRATQSRKWKKWVMSSSVEIKSSTCPNESIASELRSHRSGFDAQARLSEQGTGGSNVEFVIISNLKRGPCLGNMWAVKSTCAFIHLTKMPCFPRSLFGNIVENEDCSDRFFFWSCNDVVRKSFRSRQAGKLGEMEQEIWMGLPVIKTSHEQTENFYMWMAAARSWKYWMDPIFGW